MEVDWGNSSLLHSIMEINEVLRDNYEVVARWGFTSERKDKIKYSLLELKKNSRPVANKIK